MPMAFPFLIIIISSGYNNFSAHGYVQNNHCFLPSLAAFFLNRTIPKQESGSFAVCLSVEQRVFCNDACPCLTVECL